jgi:hypothetical protein
MAKKAKGNRVQVILNALKLRTVVCQEQAVMLRQKTVRTLLSVWN